MKLQQDLVERLKNKAEADPRVLAVWLEGSFGRGTADRFSDVDAHLLLNEQHFEAFRQDLKSWLCDVRLLVLFRLLFDNRMANCVTEDGLRVDIWLHTGDSITRPRDRVQVITAREDSLQRDEPQTAEQPDVSSALLRHIEEFWRMIAILPAVLGRNELIVAFMGTAFEANVLNEVLIIGTGNPRDTGITKLNPFLPVEARAEVESALTMNGLSANSLARAHLRLTSIMSRRGPDIAAQNAIEYPLALESSVMRYVSQELRLLGLDAGLKETTDEGGRV